MCGSRWAPRVRWVFACLCSRAGPRVCGLCLHKVSDSHLALKMSDGGRAMHLNVSVEKWHCQSGREPARINLLNDLCHHADGPSPSPSLIVPVRGMPCEDAENRRALGNPGMSLSWLHWHSAEECVHERPKWCQFQERISVKCWGSGVRLAGREGYVKI